MSQYTRNEAKSNRVTAICRICTACYEASNKSLTIGSHSRILCESSLLSMSHFCFRCRRPSCPDCWNEAYALCSSCAQATQLPMVGTTQRIRTATIANDEPLLCVKFGRYHQVQQDQEIAHISLDSTARSVSRRDVAQLQKRATQPPIHSSVAVGRNRKAQANISTNTIHGNTALDELITTPSPIKRGSKKSVVGLGFLISLMIFLVSAVVAASLSTEVNNYLLQMFHIDVRGYFFMLWNWLRRL